MTTKIDDFVNLTYGKHISSKERMNARARALDCFGEGEFAPSFDWDDGLNDPVDNYNVGATKGIQEPIGAVFVRNVIGRPTAVSQYGKPYVSYARRLPSAMSDDEVWAEVARDMKLFDGMIAVWRRAPTIERSDVGIKVSMRLHLLTPFDYRMFGGAI